MTWPMVTLGEVAEFNPRLPRTVPDDDPVSFLPMAGVSEDGVISYSEDRRVADVRKGYTHFRRGDVLLAKITPCFENGKATRTADLTTEIGAGSTEFHVVRASDKLEPSYTFHMLWNDKFRADAAGKMTGSAGQRRVPVDVVRSRAIPLPPLPEQRRIAGILDAADALRRRRREAIETLDTLQGALFAEMFGDEISSPWVAMRALADRISVGVVIRPASYYVESGVPALRSVNVKEAGFDLSDLKYFPAEISSGKLRKSELKTDDVIVVRTGQPGRAAVVPNYLAGANCIDMLVVTVSKSKLDPHFFEAFMNSERGRRMALSNQRGQIQQHLNATALKDFAFSPPSLEQQQLFAQRLTAFRSERTAMTTHLAHLDALFAALQSRAFAGSL